MGMLRVIQTTGSRVPGPTFATSSDHLQVYERSERPSIVLTSAV